VVFVSVPASAMFSQGKLNPVLPWGMDAPGLTVIILGVMLAADLRGSARAYASMMKDYKPGRRACVSRVAEEPGTAPPQCAIQSFDSLRRCFGADILE
jgi:hypothetical protein